MLNDKTRQFISINVTGRVFMFCTKEGVKEPLKIREYEKQVREFLEKKALEGAGIRELEGLTKQKLEELKAQIHAETAAPEAEAESMPDMLEIPDSVADSDLGPEINGEPPETTSETGTSPAAELEASQLNKGQSAKHQAAKHQAVEKVRPAEQVFADDIDEQELASMEKARLEKEEKEKAEKEKKRSEARQKALKSDKPTNEPMSMQEKLNISRKPVQELLTKECVEYHLLTSSRAKHWVKHMSGRLIDDVEKDIVSEMANTLQDNVKKYIRKNKKNNPWPSPMAQEQLRVDISSVKTVRGMLTLTAQVLWEIRQFKSNDTGLLSRLRNKLPW